MPNWQALEYNSPFWFSASSSTPIHLSRGTQKEILEGLCKLWNTAKIPSPSITGQSLPLPLLPPLSHIHIPGIPAHLSESLGGKELGFCRARRDLRCHFIHSPVLRQSRSNSMGRDGNLSCWRRETSQIHGIDQACLECTVLVLWDRLKTLGLWFLLCHCVPERVTLSLYHSFLLRELSSLTSSSHLHSCLPLYLTRAKTKNAPALPYILEEDSSTQKSDC